MCKHIFNVVYIEHVVLHIIVVKVAMLLTLFHPNRQKNQKPW